MDFFEAQARSRQLSRLLSLWLLLATAAMFLGAHLVTVMVFRAIPYDLTSDLHVLYHYTEDQRHSLTYLFMHPRVIAASQIPLLLFLLFTIGKKWHDLSLGGGAWLLEGLGARRLTRLTSPSERRLKNVVAEMAIASGISAPAVYVLDHENAINALCAGFGPHEAVIGVTAGALEKLNRDELQGLVAHEFGHILNGDLGLNMRLVSLMNGFIQLSLLGLNAAFYSVLIALPAAFVNSHKPDSPAIFFFVLSLLAIFTSMQILTVGGIGTIWGRSVQRAIAREREFLADASAVQFARFSAGLAGVLRKAEAEVKAGGIKSFRVSSVKHMLFQDNEPGWLATHPPLVERLKRLDAQPENRGSTEHRARANESLRRVPDSILAGLDNAGDAKNAIYATLMLDHHGETGPMIHYLASLDSPAAAMSAENFVTVLQNIDASLARDIINLAMPSLQSLDRQERGKFLKNAERLALGDGRMSSYEETLMQILRAGLMSSHAPVSPNVESLKRALALVASQIAHAGHDKDEEAELAYGKVQEYLPQINEIALRQRGSLQNWEFAKSLELLNAAPLVIKRSLLNGLKASAMMDGIIHENEQKLLDAVSQAIGLPVPQTVYDGLWL